MLPRLRSWLATAAVAGGLIAVGVWAHDVRGVYLGLAVFAARLAIATYAVLRGTAGNPPQQRTAPEPSWRPPGALGKASEAIMAAVLVLGMIFGGVLAWRANPGFLSVTAGALLAGVLLLLAFGLLACAGAMASTLWARLRRTG